ncbi:monooxygenase [Streptomyces piniterrae]|uniref:Monooxygenase n=1 Tax=Streptomyces piniterrae TaxID=2571125 RepID=A0A4U0NJA1_9ACTN|nr:FAD-dependent monooxygenase [Streptomyces piniterrae]TJZ54356.1 monooxygenase [Streptomyces piniterrae]
MRQESIPIQGGSVAIVGGSIAGCATALAAHRAGAARITVYERTAGRLADRGVGLAVHNARYAELAAAGYMDAAMPWVQLTTRRWYTRDGDAPLGRLVGVHPFPFRSYCWGPLWRELRDRLPATTDFRTGVTVDKVTGAADGATVRVAGVGGVGGVDGAADAGSVRVDEVAGAADAGSSRVGDGTSPTGPTGGHERFDLVVGADGYRSIVRDAAFPDVRPSYAGYLAWRGAIPAERLAALDLPGLPPTPWAQEDCIYVVFPGGHVIIYRIPDGNGGHRANWVLYTAPPPGLDLHLDTPTSLPPGTLTGPLHAHLAHVTGELLPPYWAGLIRLTAPQEVFIQPMYDFTAPRYTAGRLLLVGDAATVARPHTAAGAAKALQDAAALEAALRAVPNRPDALDAYGTERGRSGRTIVELGRQLGRTLVQDTPDWRTLDQAGLDSAWSAADGSGAFGGRELTG